MRVVRVLLLALLSLLLAAIVPRMYVQLCVRYVWHKSSIRVLLLWSFEFDTSGR